jgi:pimeloyl-ACP methyl ester carboxylesterase
MAAAASSNPAAVLAVLFPPDQTAAAQAYVSAITQYPQFYQATAAVKQAQLLAIEQWQAGSDPEGRQLGFIRVPALVADGALDQLNPVVNDWLIARGIHGARIILYPGASHAFLFQDSAAFIPVVDRFLGQSRYRARIG